MQGSEKPPGAVEVKPSEGTLKGTQFRQQNLGGAGWSYYWLNLASTWVDVSSASEDLRYIIYIYIYPRQSQAIDFRLTKRIWNKISSGIGKGVDVGKIQLLNFLPGRSMMKNHAPHASLLNLLYTSMSTYFMHCIIIYENYIYVYLRIFL